MKITRFYKENKEKYLGLFGSTFFSDLVSLGLMFLSAIILLSMILVLLFRVRAGEFLIPLVYNSTYEVTALGAWYKIYLYPLSYFGFILLNTLVAWAYFEKERLISYLVLLVNLFIGVLFLIFEYNLTVLIRG